MTIGRTAVKRNRHGIPWVTAPSLAAVAHEQGRACARDRAEQLELERRRGEGSVAELLGEPAVGWDRFARRADLAGTARRAHEGLSGETRAFVDAYAEGVNSELGEPTWQPWTPLAVFWVQHVLFGSFPGKLWRRHVARVVGEDVLPLLRHEGMLGGSNAFAIAGGRTASGSPIVAGDPHRVLEAPSVYAQVRLTCTDPDDAFDVVGFAFPGVPGIQHFGHAGEVAWAITNAAADAHDLAEVTEDEVVERRVERIMVRDGEPVEVTVRRTAHGPVVVEDPEPLSVRTPPDVLGDLGFEALPRLLRARSVADVEAAFDRWVEPVNNVVAADRGGRVAHFVAGRVPDRRRGAGWLTDLPHRGAGRDGVVVTANQRATPAYDVLGDDFAPPYRADRITELLAGGGHTVDSAGAVLHDVRQNAADRLLAILGDLTALPVEAALLRRRLLDWNRAMSAGSVDAARYVALRDAVVARICAAPRLAPLRDPQPHGELFDPWFHLPNRVALALPTILAAPRPFGLDPVEVVRDALAEVAESDEPRPWGEVHRFHALDGHEQFGLAAPPGPDTPLAGDTECVRMTGQVPGVETSGRASVARYVWDLADRDHSRWVVPLGASGDPDSPHQRDQHEQWATGSLLPITWEPADGRPDPATD